MSDFGISGVAGPQLPALAATQVRKPDATAQAAAIKNVGAVTNQLATTLASISSGVNIQV
jgi:hypothetical protein